MNACLPLFGAVSATTDKPANLLAAARALAPQLARSRALDRKLVGSTMTLSFGAGDAEGAWIWRDAYDAVEAALVLQVRRLAHQVSRLEDAPADVVALLAGLSALTLTHTRRSEEQLALDQFSTPLELGAVAVLAAQIRPGDRVLEPSAGTGLLAIVAEACGATLELNEIAPTRAALLDGLFPAASRTRHDAQHLADLLSSSGSFDAIVSNPPFQKLEAHLHAAIRALAYGGRLAAIVPTRLFEDQAALSSLSAHGRVVAMLAFPPRAYAKHGTSTDTGLLVIDRTSETGVPVGPVVRPETLADLATVAAGIDSRPTARPRTFRVVAPVALLQPRARALAMPAGRLGFLASSASITYETKDWTGEGRDVGLYQAYQVARLSLPGASEHPSALVEAAAMASVSPPKPTYRPVLPESILAKGILSDAQLETVIYAGEAHAAMLPGAWRVKDAAHEVSLVAEDVEGVVSFRRGFFLGDGTGCGKGRQIAGVLADNMAQGRMKAVWLSKNDALLEDARRDWCAIGGSPTDVVPQSAWKQGEAIAMEKGILFTTYATLRQPARGLKASRLGQIVAWLGADFDGVIVFDESHALANASGGAKASRGLKKASLQGMAGLAIQNLLPLARVFYVSATGATQPENLAYASRLGLWGGPEAPFNTRADFMTACDKGGVAVMELIARELKALGLYIARSLSFDGVEYEAVGHALTEADVEIWDAWADAYQVIHTHLRQALDAVGAHDDQGKPKTPLAASAAHSAFESTKQRFFAGLLAGLKAPTLVRSIRSDLAEGRSAVVQIVSTNEAVMERRLAEIPPEEWSNLQIDLSPKDQVLDYLQNAFPVHVMEEIKDPSGKVIELRPLMVDGRPVVSQHALALREALVVKLACLPGVQGVLDAVIEAFGPDQVAEITGRSRRVVTRDGRRVVERRGASAAKSETDAFMAGRKRILVFSDAGGTGRSYHADLAAGNRQRRRHYLAEPGWRADAAIQGLGRSHRTNQACAPLFSPLTTNIHGERRFLSTIARRLDSLGALTRGERRATSNGLFRASDNLESPWAHRALQGFYLALSMGTVDGWTLQGFMRKTALNLLDADGGLKASDDMPPMHTFLNRLLALRIEDQNSLFATFDAMLSGIVERAHATGELDHGMEDVVADDLEVLSEEVVRTDAPTGAETRLVRFSMKTRRRIVTAEAALDEVSHLPAVALSYILNRKSGGVALLEAGLTTIDGKDQLVPAVRLRRPLKRTVLTVAEYNESAWEEVEPAVWRASWDAEVAAADPWWREEIALVTGILLPVWAHLPNKRAWVRRIKAPDGRRWLGRVLDPQDVAKLKAALGLTETAAALVAEADVAGMILKDRQSISLTEGLWLRRARVMDSWRIELVNGAKHSAEGQALGCFVEIINYQPRVFVPPEGDALTKVLAHWPPQEITDLAA